MKNAWIFLIALLLAPGYPAAAESFTFAGRAIALDAPQGYCKLDPGNPADANFLDTMKKVQEGRNHIVLMFADCAALTAARAGRLEQLADSGAVMIIMNHGNILPVLGFSRARFIEEASRHVAVADTASLRDEMRRRIADAGAAVDIGGMKVLGVLKKDATGAYIGFILPAGAGANLKPVMSINAITLVNGLPVAVAIGRPITKEGVADELLAVEERALKQLIAANPGSDTTDEPVAEESSFDLGALEYGVIGAAAGGIGGALGLFIRRRKAGATAT